MGNKIIYIGKAGLEDSITPHDAEFAIIDGYYLIKAGQIKIKTSLNNCMR